MSCATAVGAMFDGDDQPEYLHRAVAFDSFSESRDAVIFFGDDVDDPWISVASDHLADVDPPGALTLSKYLERVLATWASIDHRVDGGPRGLDALLRERVALEPGRLVGQRVLYVDNARGDALMRARVLAVATLDGAQRDWWHGPTVVQVVDDLGEQVHVPFAALFPTTMPTTTSVSTPTRTPCERCCGGRPRPCSRRWPRCRCRRMRWGCPAVRPSAITRGPTRP